VSRTDKHFQQLLANQHLAREAISLNHARFTEWHSKPRADYYANLREPVVSPGCKPCGNGAQPGSAPLCWLCNQHRDANIHLAQYAYAGYHPYIADKPAFLRTQAE